jgi:hypothetical protein
LYEFTQNGIVSLQFSENLESIEYFSDKGLNITSLNENIYTLIDLQYSCFGSLDEEEEEEDEEDNKSA